MWTTVTPENINIWFITSEIDSDCETSAVFVVLVPDLPFIKGYIISSMVERIARTARTMREVS